MESNFNVVLRILPILTKEELKKVKGVIDFLVQDSAKDSANLTDEETLYRVITEHLLSKGIVISPFFVYRKTVYYKKFEEAFVFISLYMEKYLRLENKLQCYNLFCTQMILYLEKFDIVVNLQTVINSYEKFPEQLNRNFPGYLQSNLLKYVIT